MRTLFVVSGLLFSTTVALAAPGKWACNASGYQRDFNGGIGRRMTVNGPAANTEARARLLAMNACMGYGLSMCGVDSCSQLPW